MTDDRLIIEVVYMVFCVAIAVYFSHKVPRHLAVSTHTSVIVSCAFALWCANNHNNNGGIVTSPQHAQRGGSGEFLSMFVFLFEHVKLRAIIIIGGTNERCSACSNNRTNTSRKHLHLF